MLYIRTTGPSYPPPHLRCLALWDADSGHRISQQKFSYKWESTLVSSTFFLWQLALWDVMRDCTAFWIGPIQTLCNTQKLLCLLQWCIVRASISSFSLSWCITFCTPGGVRLALNHSLHSVPAKPVVARCLKVTSSILVHSRWWV